VLRDFAVKNEMKKSSNYSTAEQKKKDHHHNHNEFITIDFYFANLKVRRVKEIKRNISVSLAPLR
jgi:hypothetical protein